MGLTAPAELSVTGTPDAVAQVIAQANQLGWPVDMQPVGGGMFRVVARNPTVAWPTPPPPTARRPTVPTAVKAIGGTGGVVVLGAAIVLAVINPTVLFMVFVLIVLTAVGAAYAWDKAKTAVRDAIKGEKG